MVLMVVNLADFLMINAINLTINTVFFWFFRCIHDFILLLGLVHSPDFFRVLGGAICGVEPLPFLSLLDAAGTGAYMPPTMP